MPVTSHSNLAGILVQWASPPPQLTKESSVVIVLTVGGDEALRTEPLARRSDVVWRMENEVLQTPLGGQVFNLEVKSRNAEHASDTPIGHVQVNSDELLALCLQGHVMTAIALSTRQDDPDAKIELEFVVYVDKNFEARSHGHALASSDGPSRKLDHTFFLANQLSDTYADKWTFLMTIGTHYFNGLRTSHDALALPKALAAFDEAIRLILNVVPLKSDQQDFLRAMMEIYVAVTSEAVAFECDAKAIDSLSAMLNNSSTIFLMLYDRFGDRGDLRKAIELCEQAKARVPRDHPDTSIHLHRWGVATLSRFRFSGAVRDINESIASLERSVRLPPESDVIFLSRRLSNLGTAYVLRAEYARDLQDVTKAIAAHTRAIAFKEDYVSLLELGDAVLLRFMLQRDLADAEVAVVTLERALDLVPDGHPELRRCLGNLAVAYHNRFEATYRLEDIDSAVEMAQRALDALVDTGDNSPERAMHLASLGNAHMVRAEILLEVQDLHDAIKALNQAVELTPSGLAHLQKRRYNLGNAYSQRYQRLHDPRDVDCAISEFDASLKLLPEGHADQPLCLSQLAEALTAKFEATSSVEDIDRAIYLSLGALDAVKRGDYRRRSMLSHLAKSYISRFEAFQDPIDLDEAVRRYEEVMDLAVTDAEGPDKQGDAMRLARALERRFKYKNTSDDIDAAIVNYRLAATTPNGVPWTSFLAAKYWARAARTRGEDGLAVALHAYGMAVELLPRVGWIGQTIAKRHSQLVAMGSSLATEAVAVAVALGEHRLAIEWLEQARTIVWGQHFKLRSSFDDLRVAAPELATELDRVSRALDTAGSRDFAPTTDVLGFIRETAVAAGGRITADEWKKLQSHLTDLSDFLSSVGARMEVVTARERLAREQRRLAEEWERLVARIRTVPGFEDFLRPRSYSQIMKTVVHSPVVVVNADRLRCDALVLMEGRDENQVIHISLESFTFDHAQRLQSGLSRLLSAQNLRERSTRAARMVPTDPSVTGIDTILAELWKGVVKPILESLPVALPPAAGDDLPRLWWCPTGLFASLPLHAAGVYTDDEPGTKLSDFAIPSYTPTLTPFTLTRRSPSTGEFHGILSVSQTATLPNAEIESLRIQEMAQDRSVDCRSLRNEEAVIQAVLDGLDHYGWVHFACHGVQDIEEPTNSHFVLHDGSLTMLKLIAASCENADFAFLSACQTAMGTEMLPDEAAHLAAGMLAAGFKSVVGTMWSIQDSVGPIVAEQVYKTLLSGTAEPDSSQAAVALHYAVQVLRAQDHSKSFCWVPFVHFGQ
ncbi:CHAT domain-containing protein [Fomitopsis serialis]|uniref:CHAT domain-containing protein n=1 Tax=Fomitopsis serialis TaxID=139415 RepID=UPI002008913A|nr:CHAT domain-containing protein [Neoantrodia serialis]KAH9931562.1 CHAT domain-containing protein [Neoantrodia serialis]